MYSFVSNFFTVWNRLSTYEYIVRQRHRQEAGDSRKTPSENESALPKMNFIKVQSNKHTAKSVTLKSSLTVVTILLPFCLLF